MKKILSIMALIVLSLTSYGQTKKAFLKAADEAFANKNYYAALTYYNEVLEFDPKDLHALKRSAEAAQKFNAYEIALEKYTTLIDSLDYNSDSTLLVDAALMFQRLAKYDKSVEYFERYITEYGTDDDPLTKIAKRQKEASTAASARIKEIDNNVAIMLMQGDVNSAYSDFAPIPFEDSILFTSMRYLEEDPAEKPARQLSKLLVGGDDGSAHPLDQPLNKMNQSVANAVFNEKGDRLFYTVCEYKSESELRCDIYSATIQVDGKYTDERRLPSVINDSSYTTTMPHITTDPMSGETRLYFASDRPGGKGGLDIYYSVYNPKVGYAKPINVSSINTEDNEASPFFHKETSTLYFSTDGRLGLGGYDVYRSVYKGGIFEEPTGLNAPTNSSYHDLYYSLNAEADKAYMASNRASSAYIDGELKACCFDIYELDIVPKELDIKVLTFNKLTLEALDGATVQIIDAATGKLISTSTIDTSYIHPLIVMENRNYQIIGNKPGFLADTIELSTYNIGPDDYIEERLYLEPDGVLLDVFTFDADTRESLRGAKVTIEDLTDPTQNKMIEFNEDANDFHFRLEEGKSYKIIAERSGYTSVSEILDTRGVTGKITRNLYLGEFDLGAYLPIALYFDNDEPDQDSRSTYTEKVYGDLIDNYMARKKTFMERYGQGASATDRAESVNNMEEFFEGNVKGGYDQFRIFMDGLISELKNGKRIDVTVRGYASPRYNIEYNLVLAQRRVQSVKNDMLRYAGGALKPFLESKQLIVTEISYGEELSPPEVIDNLNDEKESIYSLKASLQRKVEVVSVVSK